MATGAVAMFFLVWVLGIFVILRSPPHPDAHRVRTTWWVEPAGLDPPKPTDPSKLPPNCS